MTASKDFPTAAVLSITTGILLTEIDEAIAVLKWMTGGESVFTHQIPRLCREAEPVILAAHPELAQATEETKNVTRETWRKWFETWTERYGVTIAVPKFTTDQHERIDPISEAAETFHPDNLIIAKV